MPRTKYSTEKDTMTKQMCVEVLYRLKYRNMAARSICMCPMTSTESIGR